MQMLMLALAPLLADRRQEWIPATLVGVALVLLGSWFIWSHLKSRQSVPGEEISDSPESNFARRQFGRRMQASGLIVLIGVLVPIGDWVIAWPPGRSGAIGWTFYWLFVLGLTAWVFLLALGDLASTRSHGQSALSRLQQKQRELQAEADRLRSSRGDFREDERNV